MGKILGTSLSTTWFVLWHRVADEILAECVYDVGKELEEINNDIINHVYQSEFVQLPEEMVAPSDELAAQSAVPPGELGTQVAAVGTLAPPGEQDEQETGPLMGHCAEA